MFFSFEKIQKNNTMKIIKVVLSEWHEKNVIKWCN